MSHECLYHIILIEGIEYRKSAQTQIRYCFQLNLFLNCQALV